MILVSGDGKLANALVKLSTDDLQIIKLPKKIMDITDEYMVSEVIKNYMTQPKFPKYFIHTAALTKPMSINDRNPIMSLTTNIVGSYTALSGSGEDERYLVELEFEFAGSNYGKVEFGLDNRDDLSTDVLLNRKLMRTLNVMVNPQRTYLITTPMSLDK